MLKTCRKCGETKPLDEFHRLSKSPDGRQPRCRACVRGYMKAYAARTSDRRRERRKTPESKERARAYMKEWRRGNADHRGTYQEAWRARENGDPDQFIIYALRCPDGVYIGMTSMSLRQRTQRHRLELDGREHSNALLQTWCDQYGWDAFETLELAKIRGKRQALDLEAQTTKEARRSWTVANRTEDWCPRGRRLSPGDVAEIHRRRSAGETQVSIASDFGVSDTLIRSIIKGRAYVHCQPEEV